MEEKSNSKFFFVFLMILILAIMGYVIYRIKYKFGEDGEIVTPQRTKDLIKVEKFKSEQEFKDYISTSQTKYTTSTQTFGRSMGLGEIVEDRSTLKPISPETETPQPSRVSETNVQVSGIDEPDIIKTDGQTIYYSPTQAYVQNTSDVITEERSMPSNTAKISTKIIKAFPPDLLNKIAEVDQAGEMLLSKNILIIFTYNKIYGFNISNPTKPEKKWENQLLNQITIISSRLYKDKIYTITRTNTSQTQTCPIKPMSKDGEEFKIACTEIYHPIVSIPVNSIYTVMVTSPESGKVENSVSALGSQDYSITYMSENNIYLSYYYPGDIVKFTYNFFKENKDLVPQSIIRKLENLLDYDISDQAKQTEFYIIIQQYINTLSDEENTKKQEEIAKKMEAYYKDHGRELEQSGIVKISVDGMKVEATGSVPGQPLNQFALDEYQKNLRIATTTGNGWWGLGFGGTGNTTNDVYVLNENLQEIGKIIDLGLTERIYSARFVENKGYLVTFRQIDPFYVLDLSNPKNPKKVGELKIPGYSSYLHPISKDKILGVGQENSKVKISMFNVAQASNPNELSKAALGENWTEISNNYHAFLLDTKHEAFFIPASKKGYVFSYKNDELKLNKEITDIQAKRAIYIEDYMYIIGQNKLIVLDETNWKQVKELTF